MLPALHLPCALLRPVLHSKALSEQARQLDLTLLALGQALAGVSPHSTDWTQQKQ